MIPSKNIHLDQNTLTCNFVSGASLTLAPAQAMARRWTVAQAKARRTTATQAIVACENIRSGGPSPRKRRQSRGRAVRQSTGWLCTVVGVCFLAHFSNSTFGRRSVGGNGGGGRYWCGGGAGWEWLRKAIFSMAATENTIEMGEINQAEIAWSGTVIGRWCVGPAWMRVTTTHEPRRN
jgi:hypothetical protein